jgi:phosphoglycolate phosphatase-like HAD superfamily hydrolase
MRYIEAAGRFSILNVREHDERQSTAVLWIRDGVLVDRMHINPSAFAVASYAFMSPEGRAVVSLHRLINFAFEKSGFSCAEKMQAFNTETGRELISDIGGAAQFYNELATKAARHASYFPGAIELLRDLHRSGVANYITSAVEQSVMDSWRDGTQGAQVAPYIEEILAKRSGFCKGRDHFAYVSQPRTHIIYVADAVSEIATGAQCANEFDITTIGFCNVITPERAVEGFQVVMNAFAETQQSTCIAHDELGIDAKNLRLPDGDEIVTSLNEAGATYLVSGTTDTIYQNLRARLSL